MPAHLLTRSNIPSHDFITFFTSKFLTMKKLILSLSILLSISTYSQTMTIINNTLNTITVEYREMDCSTGTSNIISTTLAPFSTYGPVTITAGYTHFPWATSFETSTSIPQNTPLLTSVLPNPSFPSCSVSPPNASSACLYMQNCTATWTETPVPVIPPNGLYDIVIEFN